MAVNLAKGLAPVVLFGYNRPQHILKTLDALSHNRLADQTDLHIFLDAAKNSDDQASVLEVIEICERFNWIGTSKDIHLRETNYGLAKNIIDGVTHIINQYGRVIVMEDDLEASEGFLKYMNDALKFYEAEELVMHVAGYMHPINLSTRQETYFYQVTSCWGWATWASSWNYYVDDPVQLMAELEKKNLLNWFDLGGSGVFLSQLERNISGSLKSWAIKWQASVNIRNGLSLHPHKSLVRNIGFDSSGTNCTDNKNYDHQDLVDGIKINEIPLMFDKSLTSKMKKFYVRDMNIVQKGLRKIKSKAISIGFDKVKWNRVKGGPGRGLLLFVNKYSFHGWREMLNGSFDSFWYKRLSDSGMKFNAILDVGAHFGYHSMCLKKLYPNSNVLAIEPNPYNAERLELHLSKNKLKEIKVLMLAASNEEGELDFSYSDNVESSQSTGSYLANVKPPLSSEHYKSFKKAKVSACTLDLICERNSFIPDLVKIDVEGAEVLVLKGSLRLLKDIKPFLCIEAHSPLLEAEVINVLKHDYQIEILDRDKGRSFLFCTPKL